MSLEDKVTLSFGKKVEHTDIKKSGEVVADTQDTEHQPAGKHTEPWANVNIHLDARIGKPNYSSVGVGVSLTMPCPIEDVDNTFEDVRAWCEERMAELTAAVK